MWLVDDSLTTYRPCNEIYWPHIDHAIDFTDNVLTSVILCGLRMSVKCCLHGRCKSLDLRFITESGMLQVTWMGRYRQGNGQQGKFFMPWIGSQLRRSTKRNPPPWTLWPHPRSWLPSRRNFLVFQCSFWQWRLLVAWGLFSRGNTGANEEVFPHNNWVNSFTKFFIS